jgi:hypothetical protein
MFQTLTVSVQELETRLFLHVKQDQTRNTAVARNFNCECIPIVFYAIRKHGHEYIGRQSIKHRGLLDYRVQSESRLENGSGLSRL